MSSLINAILGFMSKAATLAITGSLFALLVGEVKLAVLRKASQGSSKLSGFTQKMMGMNFVFLN